ncbi:type II secretion system F family protein [Clostridium saccharobutylicum]|uniref:Type II secretory pathway, component PulF n=1 Tax=Clostridium saccharobutylicum DSM 13864 TaxID=1345695 RepID=U5MS94_CLOSA|nr:type II secretion system F family protein [Clostridium saccharobutylicum]AGX43679.1 type II secretory pathway, component PulF [Clostridium saccharobutylicum DSM 13864]AQR90977.1 putative type II secretion system protein F [Clostridium saccharobutylicum]AQS00881.1 putative type II secretion system protein F [Clostridium saccharobutylicum]AQS14864.1 putative type II secretion system protein F [Clostridium saccharobutylicum]MBA2907093.1 type IV pilus assembly protein PilC [Clostridium saccharo
MNKEKVNKKQLSLIAGNLAQIYKDGIHLNTALELVRDLVTNKSYKNSLSKVLFSIKEGKSLSESFSQFKYLYPKDFTGIIAIGENTGKLYEVLNGLSIYYDKVNLIKTKIKNATRYPCFILASLGIMFVYLVKKVLPGFCDIYKSMGIPLKGVCKLLYDLNINLNTNYSVIVTAFISWSLLLIIFLRYLLKKINTEKLLRIQIVQEFFEYIMILLFSIIISTGINISTALEYCEESITTFYLREKVKDINKSILQGYTLTQSLEKSGICSKYTLAIVRIKEESGTIEEGFKELSNSLERKLYQKIQKYLSYINPIFIVIMAVCIAIFLLVFVLPLFDALQSGIR